MQIKPELYSASTFQCTPLVYRPLKGIVQQLNGESFEEFSVCNKCYQINSDSLILRYFKKTKIFRF